jgi:hypothetical protein
VFKPPPQPSRRGTAVTIAVVALCLGYASVLAGLLLRH